MEKSFLKWPHPPDQQALVLPELISLLEGFADPRVKNQTLIEPFMGSGLVVLNLRHIHNFILSDPHQDLVHLFMTMQGDGDFIEKCALYFKPLHNDVDYFNKIVTKFNCHATLAQRTHMFVYLNWHAQHVGLGRRKGFNSPFGNHEKVVFPQAQMHLMQQRLAASNVSFVNCSALEMVQNSGFGDIVYWSDALGPKSELRQQKSFEHLCAQAAQRGAKIVVSQPSGKNTDHPDCSHRLMPAASLQWVVYDY